MSHTGGDIAACRTARERMLPSIALLLPSSDVATACTVLGHSTPLSWRVAPGACLALTRIYTASRPGAPPGFTQYELISHRGIVLPISSVARPRPRPPWFISLSRPSSRSHRVHGWIGAQDRSETSHARSVSRRLLLVSARAWSRFASDSAGGVSRHLWCRRRIGVGVTGFVGC